MLLLHLVNKLTLYLFLFRFALFCHLFFHIDFAQSKCALVLRKLSIEGFNNGLVGLVVVLIWICAQSS
jgi:hypothetical protein